MEDVAQTVVDTAEGPANDPNAPATAGGAGLYAQTPEERAENRRHSAIHAAIQLHSQHHVPIKELISDASAIAAFLGGEADSE